MYAFAQILAHYGLIGENIQSKVKIICPFHEDVNPSMMVDVVEDSFICFGCGAKGNSIKFIEQLEKCDEFKAMQLRARIVRGMEKHNPIRIEIQTPLTNRQAISDAMTYFYSLPKTNWRKLPRNCYIKKRGFNSQVLNELDVRENFNHIYGVVAPMMDMGTFRGYVCRATVNEFNGKKIDRKYLYNKGFIRRNTLVGSYDLPWPVITEGFLDYARLVQLGVTNSCAILGWKITDNQISKLQQYGSKIISALDNTPSGEEGTKYLAQYFDVVRFAFPDNCKDMGDMKEHEFNMAWSKTIERIRRKKYEKE